MSDVVTKEELIAEAQRLMRDIPGPVLGSRLVPPVGKHVISKWKRGQGRGPDALQVLQLPDITGRPLDPALKARLLRMIGEPPEAPPEKDSLADTG